MPVEPPLVLNPCVPYSEVIRLSIISSLHERSERGGPRTRPRYPGVESGGGGGGGGKFVGGGGGGVKTRNDAQTNK